MKRTGRSNLLWLVVLFVIAAGLVGLRLLVDRDPLTGSTGWRWPEDSTILGLRRAAALTCVLIGASLATSGVLLQSMLRNPLASPFILGISSGAGLGVIVGMYIEQVSDFTIPGGHNIPAGVGALAAMGTIWVLGHRRGWRDPVALILIGVVISTIAASGIMFFQHLVDRGLIPDFTRWLMGRVPETMPGNSGWIAATIAVIGIAVAFAGRRAMDAAMLSDDEARSVGVALPSLRARMFIVAGILTAMTVAIAGPIGFVGLIAPHAARLLVGPRHGVLIAASCAVGVSIIAGADVARQGMDLGNGRMPIGVFTALLGGPVFLVLLRRGVHAQ